MNVLHFINAFFSDSAHWHGYDGIPTGCVEHIQYTLRPSPSPRRSGCRSGCVTGHTGRGGNALALIATAGARAAQLRSAGADDPVARASG